MSNYIDQIKQKIKNKIKLETINIIDNTEAHRSHSSFQKGKLHLTLEIKFLSLEIKIHCAKGSCSA